MRSLGGFFFIIKIYFNFSSYLSSSALISRNFPDFTESSRVKYSIIELVLVSFRCCVISWNFDLVSKYEN